METDVPESLRETLYWLSVPGALEDSARSEAHADEAIPIEKYAASRGITLSRA